MYIPIFLFNYFILVEKMLNIWYSIKIRSVINMVEVVAGIIYKDDKFLIAKRNHNKAQEGLWEFPGGKVEENETYEEALKREIKEEFNADVIVEEYIGENIHHYPEKDIKLMFYKARLVGEEIQLNEHEDYRWINKSDKDNFEFAGADELVFDLI